MISNATVKTITDLGDDVETDFTIGFPFQDVSQIKVYLQDESASPYTLTEVDYGADPDEFTITGTAPGTTVVMGTPPSTSERLLIIRVTPASQTVDYVETEAFPAADHEEAMDRIAQLLFEVKEILTRVPTLTATTALSGVVLPAPSPLGVIRWNADADALEIASGTAVSGDPVSAELIDETGVTPAGALFEQIFIAGDGGPINITANPQIADGNLVGDRLRLIGTDDTNTVLFEDSNGLDLNGGWLAEASAVLDLVWTGTLWLETSRR